MQTKYENDNIIISLYDLVDNLSDEAKKELGQQLLWSREVFKDIIEAITNDTVVTRNFAYNIFNARESILKSIGVLEKNHFRSLLSELQQEKEEHTRWEKDYWKLYHSWPSEHRANMPTREQYKHIPISHDDDKINKAMEDYGGK